MGEGRVSGNSDDIDGGLTDIGVIESGDCTHEQHSSLRRLFTET